MYKSVQKGLTGLHPNRQGDQFLRRWLHPSTTYVRSRNMFLSLDWAITASSWVTHDAHGHTRSLKFSPSHPHTLTPACVSHSIWLRPDVFANTANCPVVQNLSMQPHSTPEAEVNRGKFAHVCRVTDLHHAGVSRGGNKTRAWLAQLMLHAHKHLSILWFRIFSVASSDCIVMDVVCHEVSRPCDHLCLSS